MEDEFQVAQSEELELSKRSLLILLILFIVFCRVLRGSLAINR